MGAEIQVDFSRKAMLEDFLGYVTDRAGDASHAADGDAIADFVEKFMIVEIRRLSAKDETKPGTIMVPDNVLKGPLKALKAKLDKQFEDALDEPSSPAAPAVKPEVQPATLKPEPKLDGAPQSVPVRLNGNGHARLKKRDLTDMERDIIRARFIAADGQITDDLCVEWKDEFNTTLHSLKPLTSFQIAGFVSYLHGEVSRGKIKPHDLDAYKKFLDTHRALYPKRYPRLAAARVKP